MTSSLHGRLAVQRRSLILRIPCDRAPRPQRRPVKAVSEAPARPAASADKPDHDVPASSIIVGGGPCGLAAAMYLSQLGWRDIEVWDKRSHPCPSDDGMWGTGDRSYSIGITAKGQAALRELGVYDRVVKCCAPIMFRHEWNPQNPEGKRRPELGLARSEPTQVLQRDRLVACMLEHIEEEYAGRVRVRHNIQVHEIAVQGGGKVSLKWSQAPPGSDGTALPRPASTPAEGVAQTDFLVGADGASSAVRALLEEQGVGKVRTVHLEEKPENTRVYKTILMPLQHTEYTAEDGSGIFALSERSKAGRVLESLPSKEGNQLGLILCKIDDEEALSISTEEEAAKFLQREFPNLYPFMPRSEIAAFAERPVGKLPTFKYAWPHLHYSNNVVLAGDAIHTVKPYFGIGVNSALDDVRWLNQCLTKHPEDRAAALALYSRERAVDAQAVVVESHKADQGFWQFVFPIIMDSIFNKLFPGLFRPTMFQSMNQGDVRFSEARRRKRLDRTIQFAMIGMFVAAVCTAFWKLFTMLSRFLCAF